MKLMYFDEIIVSPDGIECHVLDISKIDFARAVIGRKTSETLVRCAQGGEEIETKDSEGQVESVYTAQRGDAIFINLHNMNDIYVPGNKDGTRWQFSELTDKGYEIVSDDTENGGVRVKNLAESLVLHEVIQKSSCIKDAHGVGQHQFLFKGASLKKSNQNSVSGIAKEAFDATWEITKGVSKPTSKATRRLQSKP